MAAHIQGHADYHNGFYDAEEGRTLPVNASGEYREGWHTYHRAERILKRFELA